MTRLQRTYNVLYMTCQERAVHELQMTCVARASRRVLGGAKKVPLSANIGASRVSQDSNGILNKSVLLSDAVYVFRIIVSDFFRADCYADKTQS